MTDQGVLSAVAMSFFLFSFMSLSSFFTHIETNQSVGGAKTGVPGEKPPDTPASKQNMACLTFTTCLGGKVSHFPYLQTGVKVLSLPPERCESIFCIALDTARAVRYEK